MTETKQSIEEIVISRIHEIAASDQKLYRLREIFIQPRNKRLNSHFNIYLLIHSAKTKEYISSRYTWFQYLQFL